jgi:hypothetical protein
MEKVRILGIDPSLRNTGLAIIEYDTEKEIFSAPCECQVISNPAKYTGTDAIINMLDMLQTASLDSVYNDVNDVIIESPAIMFSKSWAGGTISPMAHIAGGSAVLFGLQKVRLFRPNEWNRCRKKEITHNQTIAILGEPSIWHYRKRVKSERFLEHILDAASMALWYIKNNFVYETEQTDLQ